MNNKDQQVLNSHELINSLWQSEKLGMFRVVFYAAVMRLVTPNSGSGNVYNDHLLASLTLHIAAQSNTYSST